MEAEHKRRSGFMKSLYKAAKPGSQAWYSSKVKPNPTATNGSLGVKMQKNFSTISQTLSSAKPYGFVHSEAEVHVYNHSHGDYGGDENVDSKASTYISYVRERFKVERTDSNVRMHKDMC
ncbi:hypothetical protein FEM48_Zijuj10G0029700 [Ziziphus jujuba var. spinosa]|uniref:Uncharacterized protein n=1 Tax=Ziziphus jujuba var. spinosa TaxID=714518 RepID=A0A978UKW7_ZIZJJ|nr:hypothetical protein FEM48_Zijuj10G0029700 [Ziziphus jujuba var. spinosa]